MGIANANASSSHDGYLVFVFLGIKKTLNILGNLCMAMLQAAMMALLLSLVETETGRTAWALPMPMLQAAMMPLSPSPSKHQETI